MYLEVDLVRRIQQNIFIERLLVSKSFFINVFLMGFLKGSLKPKSIFIDIDLKDCFYCMLYDKTVFIAKFKLLIIQ